MKSFIFFNSPINSLRLILSALFLCTLAACGGGNDSTTTNSTSSTPSTATPTSLAGCMNAAGGPSTACLTAMTATTSESDCVTLGSCYYTKSDGTFVYSKSLSGCGIQKDIATGKPSSSINCNGAIAASTSAAACTDMGANHPSGHWSSVRSNDTTLQSKLKCAYVLPTTSGK